MFLAHGWNVLGVGFGGAAAAWAAATACLDTVFEGTRTGAGVIGWGVGRGSGLGGTGRTGTGGLPLIGVPCRFGSMAIPLQ